MHKPNSLMYTDVLQNILDATVKSILTLNTQDGSIVLCFTTPKVGTADNFISLFISSWNEGHSGHGFPDASAHGIVADSFSGCWDAPADFGRVRGARVVD